VLPTGLIAKPEPGPSPICIYDARFRPESHIYRLSYDMRTCAVTKDVVHDCSSRCTVYHTHNNNHLDQNIGLNKYKLNLLVNDNTSENNVSQERKKLYTMALLT